MKKPQIVFVSIAVLAVCLAAFLTWNLLNPREVEGFYQMTIGAMPNAPANQEVARGTLVFEKAEDDNNG